MKNCDGSGVLGRDAFHDEIVFKIIYFVINLNIESRLGVITFVVCPFLIELFT
jgi:hypothetical protein